MTKKVLFLKLLVIACFVIFGLKFSPAHAQGAVYTLSGQITGDAKDDVTVSCGNYKTTTDYSGNYSITSIAQGSCCDITPSNSDYEFYPLSIQRCFTNSNAVGVNFIATFISHSDYSDSNGAVKKRSKDMFQESSGKNGAVANNESATATLPAISNDNRTGSSPSVSVSNTNSANSSGAVGPAGGASAGGSGDLTAKNSSTALAPQTGLSQKIIFYLAIFLALIAMGIFLIFKRKKN